MGKELDRGRAAGVVCGPGTGREHVVLVLTEGGCGFVGWAVGGNGALGRQLGTGERLFERSITVEAQQALVAALEVAVPGVLHASVREEGEVFVAQEGYAELADFEDHQRGPASMGAHALEAVGSAERCVGGWGCVTGLTGEAPYH